MSLTSGFQDHLQRPPPRCRPQLEGLGQVVADGDPAEDGFFFLEREKGVRVPESRGETLLRPYLGENTHLLDVAEEVEVGDL